MSRYNLHLEICGELQYWIGEIGTHLKDQGHVGYRNQHIRRFELGQIRHDHFEWQSRFVGLSFWLYSCADSRDCRCWNIAQINWWKNSVGQAVSLAGIQRMAFWVRPLDQSQKVWPQNVICSIFLWILTTFPSRIVHLLWGKIHRPIYFWVKNMLQEDI